MDNKSKKRRQIIPSLGFLAAGMINGLLGSGGGMIAVPALEHSGIKANRAHATSVAVMLPLSAVSAVFYLWGGNVSLSHALPYIPGGIAGALIGVLLLRRVSPSLLRRLFGGVAVYSGLRILLR